MSHDVVHPMDTRFDAEGDRYRTLAAIGKSLGSASLSPIIMATTGEWLTGHDRPHMYFTYPALDDKQAYLDSIAPDIAKGMGTEIPARMLKTVTLTYGSGDNAIRVLVGSVGRRIDTAVKKSIAQDWMMPGIEVSKKQAKAAVINAHDDWNVTKELGIQPGIIGPLFWSDKLSVLSYYFLAEDFGSGEQAVPVELALSPEASLVMRYDDLFDMLPTAQAAFTGRPNFFRVIPSHEPQQIPAS